MLSASCAVSAFLLLLLLLLLASAAGASAAAAAAAAAATALRTAGWCCSVFHFLFELFYESYMVVDVVVQNLRKVTCTNMRKNMYVVTPRLSLIHISEPTRPY